MCHASQRYLTGRSKLIVQTLQKTSESIRPCFQKKIRHESTTLKLKLLDKQFIGDKDYSRFPRTGDYLLELRSKRVSCQKIITNRRLPS